MEFSFLKIPQYGLSLQTVAYLAATANATFTTAYLNNHQNDTGSSITLSINNSQKPLLLLWVFVENILSNLIKMPGSYGKTICQFMCRKPFLRRCRIGSSRCSKLSSTYWNRSGDQIFSSAKGMSCLDCIAANSPTWTPAGWSFGGRCAKQTWQKVFSAICHQFQKGA